MRYAVPVCAALWAVTASVGAPLDSEFIDRVDWPGFPTDVALGDVTGDGLADAVLTYANPDSPLQGPGVIVVLVNTGSDGVDGEPIFVLRDNSIITNQAIGPRPDNVRLGDLNNDGHIDIVVSSPGNNDNPGLVTWLISDGKNDAGFVASQVFPVQLPGTITDIAIGELTGDQFPDVAATIRDQGVLIVIRNGGPLGKDGRRTELDEPDPDTPDDLPGLAEPTSIEPGDFDNASDDRDEVVVADPASKDVTVYKRDDKDGLVPLASVPVADGETKVASDSIDEPSDDRNGKAPSAPDIFVLNRDRSIATIILNNSQGGEVDFDEPVSFQLAGENTFTRDAELVDLDGDGLPEIVALIDLDPNDSPTGFLRVFRNVSEPGQPAFELVQELLAGQTPRAIAASSDVVSGDCPELVAANGPKVPANPGDTGSIVTLTDSKCLPTTGGPCPGDFNGSDAIDLPDLLALLAAFGTPSGTLDLDGSGIVDLPDLLAVLAQFGQQCPQ